MNLKEMQDQHAVWSERNFGHVANPDHPLLGVIEEVGELCEATVLDKRTEDDYVQCTILDLAIMVGRLAHIFLKRSQGIRKGSTGDEYLQDTINRLHEAYLDLEYHTGFRQEAVQDGGVYEESHERSQDAVGDVTIYLMDYCRRRDWDMGEIVERTLNEVTSRDWIKDPVKGTAA